MDTKWTEERDAKAANTLIEGIFINKDRRYYHVLKKFDFTFLKVSNWRSTSAMKARSMYYGSS